MFSLKTISLIRLLLGVFTQTSVYVCSLHPNGNLDLTSRVEAILSLVPQDRVHEPHYVNEREIRDLLDDCVAGEEIESRNVDIDSQHRIAALARVKDFKIHL